MSDHAAGPMVCLGEAMVMLAPEQSGGLAGSALLRRSVGGAEANVAGNLATLGLDASWVSRLGDDPFGDYIVADLEQRGVTVIVERDPHRPTGLYLKEPASSGSRMHYYRTGSAASALDESIWSAPDARDAIAGGSVVHTSGITAGILAEDSGLLSWLLEARERFGFRLSVDLNWRPALWRGRSHDLLTDLVRAADLLLMGADEALEVFGTSEPRGLRERVGHRATLVIKSDAHVATEITPEGCVVEVPALTVDVVEPVGAGDGFAAGYLAGTAYGYDAAQRLRLGHVVAAGVLAEPGDHATRLPDEQTRRTLLEMPEGQWRSVRVSAAGVHLPTTEARP